MKTQPEIYPILLDVESDIQAGMTHGSSSMSASMSYIAGIMLALLSYGGVALLIYGLFKWAMSMKEDQPEEKTKAITMMSVGAILIGIRAIFKAVGLIG